MGYLLTTYRTVASAFVGTLALVACSSTARPAGSVTDGSITDTAVTDTAVADGAPTDARADAGSAPMGTPVTTYQFDLQRSGVNRTETQLTPAVLLSGRFGMDSAFAPALDGPIYAQPLYLPGITVQGTTHDVLFVATQANTVFALDAATGATLWHTGLGTPVPRASLPCGNITPTMGVLSTPVIDPATGTLYAVAYTVTPSGTVFTVNGLDVTTGAQRTGYPAPIAPPASNGSSFAALAQGQRGALSLVDGRVYAAFGGLAGDCGVYHGWVVGIDTTDPSHQTAFATPGRGSGIWAAGGLSGDGAGHLFVSTGNSTGEGNFTADSMSEYVAKLGTGATGPTATMAPTDWFAPSDAMALDVADLDVGSITPVILPDVNGRHLLAQGSKSGVVYLLDRDNLGGNGTGDGTSNEGMYSARLFSAAITGAGGAWSDGTHTWVFIPGRGTRANCPAGTGGVMALEVVPMGSGFRYTTAWCTATTPNPNPPAVSANGNQTAVLWVAGARLASTDTGSLSAYSVADGTLLYTAMNGDVPEVRQWVPPVVADGRVYVTGATTVQLYRVLR